MSDAVITRSAREALERLDASDRRAVVGFMKNELDGFAAREEARDIDGFDGPVWSASVKGGPIVVFARDDSHGRYVVLSVIAREQFDAVRAVDPSSYEVGRSLVQNLLARPPTST